MTWEKKGHHVTPLWSAYPAVGFYARRGALTTASTALLRFAEGFDAVTKANLDSVAEKPELPKLLNPLPTGGEPLAGFNLLGMTCKNEPSWFRYRPDTRGAAEFLADLATFRHHYGEASEMARVHGVDALQVTLLGRFTTRQAAIDAGREAQRRHNEMRALHRH